MGRFVIGPVIAAVAVIVGAYFVGSIPIGVLLSRRRGVDIRAVGSGNIGATHVSRSLGRKLGAIVLVLDALKGALPVLAVVMLELDQRVDPFVLTATGFAAIAGHCFPIWLRFDGGKGVATALGVYLVVDPLVTGICMAIFAACYLPFRIVSIGSMTAAVAFPVLLLVFGQSDAAVALGIAVGLVIIYRHRGNLGRLLRRGEPSA
ncbi:MAG TPA: glycerol-3-phosphate 1-O-acyltransferase PlsY [Kofleriaceae bacterium]|nr:glycerol-3-phosphate 1-O-acyltransferase PlsY [Kofleriaceae bacterium]